MKLYESPYNFPSSSDLVDLKDLSTGSKDLHTHYAIGDKVKFKIGPTAEVDAYIYAVRFEAATVWYDLLFDPYVGTPDEGSYTILTNVRALMVQPHEFEQRIQRITESEAKRIKMKMYESKKKMKEAPGFRGSPDDESEADTIPEIEHGLSYIQKGLRQSGIRNLQDKERLIHCISDLIRTCDQNGEFTATSERKFQMFLSNM
jgi:hypothetical protein